MSDNKKHHLKMQKYKRKIDRFLKNRAIRFNVLAKYGFLRWIPDEVFLKKQFKLMMGYPLNLNEPRTFNEKMQWIKINDRKPIYTVMVDKYQVKQYVADKIGEKHIIPMFGVWNCAEEIDFGKLPKQFVLKRTHDSGGVIIVRDKDNTDLQSIKKKINAGMLRSHYHVAREWPYKNVKPRIIAEKYMTENNTDTLKDYKVLCFNGIPRLIELHRNRFRENHTQDFYDVNWKKTDIIQDCPMSEEVIDKPACFDEMMSFSKLLAKDIPCVRIDWYIVKGVLYFGEFTFFDSAGYGKFDDFEHDLMIGSWIDLKEEKDV